MKSPLKLASLLLLLLLTGCVDDAAPPAIEPAKESQPENQNPTPPQEKEEKTASLQEKPPEKNETEEIRCEFVDCKEGDKVISFVSKKDGEFFYGCDDKDVSEYVNFVMAMLSLNVQIGAGFPDISPVTGDPELEGESQSLLDSLRSKARVDTYDEAFARCSEGKNDMKLIVMYNSKRESGQILVSDEKTKKTFWMPKSSLNLRK